MAESPSVYNEAHVRHPLQVRQLSAAEVIVFRNDLGSALIKGTPTDGTLVRIQSACQYGEIYGSVECDCRDQLDYSLEQIAKAREGIIVHLLKQEGRGQGLWIKGRSIRLSQETGLSSVQAYTSLGKRADVRNYGLAVAVIQQLGLRWVRLMTNNPMKIAAVERAGIRVSPYPATEHRDFLLGLGIPVKLWSERDRSIAVNHRPRHRQIQVSAVRMPVVRR